MFSSPLKYSELSASPPPLPPDPHPSAPEPDEPSAHRGVTVGSPRSLR
jgi:hypothetical protein